MASYDTNPEEILGRLRRLEFLVGGLVVAGAEPNDAFDDYYYLLLREATREPTKDDFARLMRDLRGSLRFSRSKQTREIEFAREFVDNNVGIINNRISSMNNDIESYQHQLNEISLEFHEFLSIISLGISTSEIKIRRPIPLRAYLPQQDLEQESLVSTAIENFADEFGFAITDDPAPTRRSWLKKWLARSKEALTEPEVVERLGKIEKALEMKGLDLPQAEIDQRKSSAIAGLIKSLEHTPTAAIQVGSILLVKIPTKDGPLVQVKTLSTREILQIENNQDLLASPVHVLEKLASLCDGHKEVDSNPSSSIRNGLKGIRPT